MTDISEHRLRRGAQNPYDAPDAWWNGDGSNPPPAADWAHAAARGVIADLMDRHTIKHAFAHNIDEDVRAELVGSLADIIRTAWEKAQ